MKSKVRLSRRSISITSETKRSKVRRSRKSKVRRSRSRKTKRNNVIESRKSKSKKIKKVTKILNVLNALRNKTHEIKFKNKTLALQHIEELSLKLQKTLYGKKIETSSGLNRFLWIFGSNKTVKVLSSLIILIILSITTYNSLDIIKNELINIIDKLINILFLFIPENLYGDFVDVMNSYALAGQELIVNAASAIGERISRAKDEISEKIMQRLTELTLSLFNNLGYVAGYLASNAAGMAFPALLQFARGVISALHEKGYDGAIAMVLFTVALLVKFRAYLLAPIRLIGY